MSFLGQEYVAAELPEGKSFEPVPAGWYSVQIVSAELRPTKAGDGEYIAIRYDITGPEYQGRVVFGNLNLKNKNPKAEEIGRQQLGELMRSIGLASARDTDQLIGGTLDVKLSIRKSDEWGDKNEVKAFRASIACSMPTNAKPPTSNGGAKAAAPPWAKDSLPF